MLVFTSFENRTNFNLTGSIPNESYYQSYATELSTSGFNRTNDFSVIKEYGEMIGTDVTSPTNNLVFAKTYTSSSNELRRGESVMEFEDSVVRDSFLNFVVSPTQQINLDIYKNITRFNIDNYVGDGRYVNRDGYSDLIELNNTY